jgi:hypothetical protein
VGFSWAVQAGISFDAGRFLTFNGAGNGVCLPPRENRLAAAGADNSCLSKTGEP